MCFLPPALGPRKIRKERKRTCGRPSRSTSPFPIRVTDISCRPDIHQVDYPTATVPDYLTTRYCPGLMVTPPTFPNPPWSPPHPTNPYPPNPDPSPYSNRQRNRDHRTEALEEIEFVNTLKSKLVPPPPAKKEPSETERKIMEDLKGLAGMMMQKQKIEDDDKTRAASERQHKETMQALVGLQGGGNGNGGAFGSGNGGGGYGGGNGAGWAGGGGPLVYGSYQRRRSSGSGSALGVVTKLLADTVRGVESQVRRVEDRMSEVEWDCNDMQQRTPSDLRFRGGSGGRFRTRRVY